MIPTFSVLVGSIGRPTLRDALDSVARQRRIPGDQFIVGLDALDRSPAQLEAAHALVCSYADEHGNADDHDPQFLSFDHVGINTDDEEKKIGDVVIAKGAPYHWLGVEQINHALRTFAISGSHVFTIGDDDVFVDGAYDVIRDVCARHQSRPVLFRFLSPARDRLWDIPRLRGCLISGCCIAAPRQYVGLHPTMISTMHDYFWIEDIVRKANADGHPPIWLDYVGVIARPPAAGPGEVKHRGVWTCGCGRGWGYVEDGFPTRCAHCYMTIDAAALAGRIVEAVQS